MADKNVSTFRAQKPLFILGIPDPQQRKKKKIPQKKEKWDGTKKRQRARISYLWDEWDLVPLGKRREDQQEGEKGGFFDGQVIFGRGE